MKIKDNNTGNVFNAKRFKDLTDMERRRSIAPLELFEPEDMFVNLYEDKLAFVYIHPDDYTILREEED